MSRNKINNILSLIAQKHLSIETLETRKNINESGSKKTKASNENS